MSKVDTPKGKLVRKFGENIFGNPKYDTLLNKKPYTPGQHGPNRRKDYRIMVFNFKKSKKLRLCMVFLRSNLEITFTKQRR